MTTIQWHIIRILYVSEPEPDTETYAWNETAPEPRDNKRANISKNIRSYVFVAWFSDLFVAIRIYSLACLYNLKANRNQFSKYFEVYMILKDDCTERPLLAIDVWSAEVETCNLILFHPPLRLSIFYGSRDQPRPGSFLKKREEPGNEAGLTLVTSAVDTFWTKILFNSVVYIHHSATSPIRMIVINENH
jgi:hypothetical protein